MKTVTLTRRVKAMTLVALAATVAIGIAPTTTAAPVKDTLRLGSLTTSHLTNPLGIDDARPAFAWTISTTTRSVRQTAYQVLVATSPRGLDRHHGNAWDSGRVASAVTADVTYRGRALKPRTRYFWKVRAWDDHGRRSAWSAPAWFETAFLSSSDWQARWIGKDTGTAVTPEPLLRREVTLRGKVASARAYVAGIGYHKLFVNGSRIGDHEMDPGLTDFGRTVLYVTHDVTRQLRTGRNAIGVSLGRGFYGNAGPATACADWCGQPKVKLQLHVRYTDGSSSVIVSDGSWRVANGPTVRDSVFSETYDARLEKPQWTRPGFNDRTWSSARLVTGPSGVLRAQRNEPIKVVATRKAARVTEPQPGTRVFDMGFVTAGWVRIGLQGPAGTTLTVQYSEQRRGDGTVAAQGGQTDTYVLRDGGRETYEPSYGYRGFQYVQVTSSAPVTIRSFRGLEVHSAVRSAGGFASSDPLLNRYHQAMRRTLLNNLHSVPTDTPVFEKLGYGGDALLFGESAIRNFGMAAFFDKWMADFTDAQLPNGMIPVVVPDGHGRTEDDPIWGSAVVLIHRYLYMSYGDVSILRRGYPTMKRWLDYYASQIRSTGYVYTGKTYGDWTGCVVSCSVPPVEQGPPNATAQGGSAFPYLIGTAFLYRSAKELAELARAVGKGDDARRLKELAANIATAFHQRFYNPVTRTYGDVPGYYVQTSNLLALEFGLAPPEVRRAVAANLAADVASRSDHLNTGATGSKLILPALTDAGYGEQAYRVATNPTYPGWGHLFLSCGATTMWESWTDCSSDLRRGGNPLTGSTAPRSMDHAFFGTVDDWLFTHLAGIRPTAPAFRKIEIRPHVVGKVSWAAASQTTPSGRVASCWEKTPSGLVVTATVPVNATSVVAVPAAEGARVLEVGTGRAVPVAQADGVTAVRKAGGRVLVSVGSGHYAFVVGSVESPRRCALSSKS